jgi:hypothetical protein
MDFGRFGGGLSGPERCEDSHWAGDAVVLLLQGLADSQGARGVWGDVLLRETGVPARSGQVGPIRPPLDSVGLAANQRPAFERQLLGVAGGRAVIRQERRG